MPVAEPASDGLGERQKRHSSPGSGAAQEKFVPQGKSSILHLPLHGDDVSCMDRGRLGGFGGHFAYSQKDPSLLEFHTWDIQETSCDTDIEIEGIPTTEGSHEQNKF